MVPVVKTGLVLPELNSSRLLKIKQKHVRNVKNNISCILKATRVCSISVFSFLFFLLFSIGLNYCTDLI